MKKYLVTFIRKNNEPFAMIEVYAPNFDELDFFMRRFYPDTNWDYEVIE